VRMKDLPVVKFKTTLSRRMYAFFWAPIDVCVTAIVECAGLARLGFMLALIGWTVLMAFMYFTSSLTAHVALGLAVIAFMVGAGITALLVALTLLERMLRG
jgi:hypothetical protein